MKRNIGLKILVYAFVVFLVVLYLFPLLYAVNTSLMSKLDYMKNPVSIGTSVHFENYVNAFKKANFASYIGNSLFYLAICTSASVLMAVFLAFPISRKYLKYAGIVYAFFLAGLFLPDGTIPQFQLILMLKLYNTRLGYMLGLMGGGGIPLVFFVSYLKNIPVEFDEAASIDGCGYFRYAFKILIPLMKPAIASMAILTAIGVWNDIIRAMIYLSKENLFPVTRGLWAFQGQYQVDTTLQMAAMIMVAAPLVVLYIFLQRYIIDGVVAGAIKA
jgi:raffinose/stachyose/melibiose transport system permease protein